LADSPPDLIIYPRVRHVGLLDFGLIETCFAEGDAAAREMLPEIEKLVAPESEWMIHRGWRRFFEWARRVFPIRRWSDF
jgi:hypothetical protein